MHVNAFSIVNESGHQKLASGGFRGNTTSGLHEVHTCKHHVLSAYTMLLQALEDYI